jgi:hypothetical protein
MTRATDFVAADTVQPPSDPDPVPLAPDGCESDWRACLDAGQDKGPTSAHQDEGWRAIDTAKP